MALEKIDLRDDTKPKVKPHIETEKGVTHGEVFGAAYQVSIWGMGKHGVGLKVYVEQREGESMDQMAKRANKFLVGKFRETEIMMEDEVG